VAAAAAAALGGSAGNGRWRRAAAKLTTLFSWFIYLLLHDRRFGPFVTERHFKLHPKMPLASRSPNGSRRRARETIYDVLVALQGDSHGWRLCSFVLHAHAYGNAHICGCGCCIIYIIVDYDYLILDLDDFLSLRLCVLIIICVSVVCFSLAISAYCIYIDIDIVKNLCICCIYT